MSSESKSGRPKIKIEKSTFFTSQQQCLTIGAIKVTSTIANSNYLILQVVTSSLIAPYY